MTDREPLRSPYRDPSETDPVQGEEIPTDPDELATERAAATGDEGVPQPPGDPGDPAKRGAGSDLGLDDDPEATNVGESSGESG